MKFSFSFFTSFRSRITFSLRALLNISWWVLLGLLFIVLFSDGFFFYLYGLGYAEPPLAPGPQTKTIPLEEDAIRRAASLIQDSETRFRRAPVVPADLPDPFK